MRWTASDIAFEVIDDGTDDPIVTIAVGTPAGWIMIMAVVEEGERTFDLRGFHIHGEAPNIAGPQNLRVIADVVMERMNRDAIEVEGEARTTGAGPGRRPRRLRFTRRPDPSTVE